MKIEFNLEELRQCVKNNDDVLVYIENYLTKEQGKKMQDAFPNSLGSRDLYVYTPLSGLLNENFIERFIK